MSLYLTSADPEVVRIIRHNVDVTRLCEHLADRIAEDGSKRPAIGKTWIDAARLMLDRDGRTVKAAMLALPKTEWAKVHHARPSKDRWKRFLGGCESLD